MEEIERETKVDEIPDHLADLYERSTANLSQSEKNWAKELLTEVQDVSVRDPANPVCVDAVPLTGNTADTPPLRQPPN